MAAYAAVVNLLNIVDQIQDHPRLSIALQLNQIHLLQQNLHFFLDFLDTAPYLRRSVEEEEEAQALERQITSATYAAEDVIETHVVDQIQTAAAVSISSLDLQTLIREMNYVKQTVISFRDQIKDPKPKYYPHPVSASSPETPLTTTGKSAIVGFDHERYQLMDALTGHRSALQIIPIVGMGGIGKTTLAKTVYESPLIFERFDTLAWATISQQFSIKDIFSNLLSCQTKCNSTPETEYQQLAQELYQSLIGRRYLIVLDDMWCIGVWDRIRFFFPDNDNGSRIVVTTRLSNMAAGFGTSLLPLKLLDQDNSWKLFCEKAFPHEEGCCCPCELEEFGKKIVTKCRGLPLLIVVIGALVRKFPRTRECWEDVSADINSFLHTKDEEIRSLDILYLSYRHLPAHLKSCFLYMGIFPEDHVIRVSRLIKLWVAEGFVRSDKTQSLEELARGYLKDLIDRNLLVLRTDRYGERETCQMHDLLRDLCLKIAEKENFLCLVRANDVVDKGRRIVFQKGASYDGFSPALPFTRSLVSHDNGGKGLVKFKLLRVLNVSSSFCGIGDILKLLNLRYICIYRDFSGHLLSSISLLWNLQTLIGETFVAPPEFWEMRQLRHVKMYKVILPDPPLSSIQSTGDAVVLRNLQSLKRAWDLKLSEDVCKRIPNVKRLSLFYNDLSENYSYDFGRLHKLEFLKCVFWKKPNLLQNLIFPCSLQKLILDGCYLRWEDLSMIGSLPHLQVLQLHRNSVTGPEWDPVEGEFLSLKFLKISSCDDLINWNADESSFPVLERLVLHGLWNLNEIPSGIGEIPTLGLIDLVFCSDSLAVSAMEILEEQVSLGNEGLQVRIRLSSDSVEFKKKVQHMECFSNTSFLLIDY